MHWNSAEYNEGTERSRTLSSATLSSMHLADQVLRCLRVFPRQIAPLLGAQSEASPGLRGAVSVQVGGQEVATTLPRAQNY